MEGWHYHCWHYWTLVQRYHHFHHLISLSFHVKGKDFPHWQAMSKVIPNLPCCDTDTSLFFGSYKPASYGHFAREQNVSVLKGHHLAPTLESKGLTCFENESSNNPTHHINIHQDLQKSMLYSNSGEGAFAINKETCLIKMKSLFLNIKESKLNVKHFMEVQEWFPYVPS